MTEQTLNPGLTENRLDRSKVELGSTTFNEIKRFVEARIETLRKKNDNRKLDSEQTAALRGGIAELNDFLNKCEPPKMPTSQRKPQLRRPGEY